jgi:hypothetical protein
LSSINQVNLVTEARRDFFEVGNSFLNIMWITRQIFTGINHFVLNLNKIYCSVIFANRIGIKKHKNLS